MIMEDISLKVSNVARDLMKVTGMNFIDARNSILETIEQTVEMTVIPKEDSDDHQEAEA